jgi:polysaccharide export outer membrane protein
MKLLRIFRGPLHRQAKPSWGVAMLRQSFLTQTSKQRGLPSGSAAVQIAILILICASSLAGCASSPNQTASDGGPGSYAFQSNSDVVGSSAFGFQPTASSGTQRDAQAPGALSAISTAGNSGYLVGPTDILEISVFKVPELSKSVQVADTGTINLPLVGEVQASGKTASEIEKDLTRQLGAKYLKSPQVTVYVKEHNSQRVTIEGAVRRPGVYPIRGTLSLVQLLATAEGVDRDLYSKDVTVFRTVDGNRTPRVFDIDAIREGKADDPQLRQGDLVVVDTSFAKSALQNTLKIVPATAGTAAALRPF